VPAFPDNATIPNNHAADHGIGADSSPAPLGQFQGPAHVRVVAVGKNHNKKSPDRFRGTPTSHGNPTRPDRCEASGTRSSPIRTVTVGSGITPDLRFFTLAGFTAGRGFHPAPKIGL